MGAKKLLSATGTLLVVVVLTVLLSSFLLLARSQMGMVQFTGGGWLVETFNVITGYLGYSVLFFVPVLIGYGLFAVSHLDFYLFRTDFLELFDPVILLIINLCPLLWLKFFYETRNPAAMTSRSFEEKLSRFCREFGISKREREIIQQVMAGRSNKEIWSLSH